MLICSASRSTGRLASNSGVLPAACGAGRRTYRDGIRVTRGRHQRKQARLHVVHGRELGQNLSRHGSRVARDGEEQMLDAEVGVVHRARDLRGASEDCRTPGRHR